jgi:hypothetical protein
MGVRIYIDNVNIRAWMDRDPTRPSGQAYGEVPTLDLEILGDYDPAGPLPITPTGGMEVVFYNHNANPLLHEYYFTGKIVQITQVPTVEDKRWIVKCEGWERELNHHVPHIEWAETDFPTDKDRIIDLGTASGMDLTQWDFTSRVGGPFISYPTGSLQGFHRQTVWDILWGIASDPGQPGDGDYPVPIRRMKVDGEWTDPSNPTTSTITKFINYYSGATTGINTKPLVTRGVKLASWVLDDFTVPSMGALPDAPTLQPWVQQNGTIGSDGTMATVFVDGSAPHPTLAYVGVPTVSDGQLSAVVGHYDDGWGLAFRVVAAPPPAWEGFMLYHSGGRLQLAKWEAGAETILAAPSVALVNGDIVTVILSGTSIIAQVNGSTVISVTSSFQQTAVIYGMAVPNRFGGGTMGWNSFRVKARGIQTIGRWRRELDWSGMLNVLPIAGPGSDPFPANWQHQVGVAQDGGFLWKNYDPGAWQATHGYLVGDRRRPIDPNGRQYKVTAVTTGISGSSPPAWSTALLEGQTVVDAGVTWTCETWNAGAYTDSPGMVTEDGGQITARVGQMVLGADAFGREDSSLSLGDAEVGGTYALYALSGTGQIWGIQANRARVYAGTGGGLALIDQKASTGIFSLTLPVVVAGSGLAFRFFDATNGWYLIAESAGGGRYGLYKVIAGTPTLMGSYSTALADGVALKVSCHNSTIDVYVNDVFRFTVTDTKFEGCTLWGMVNTTMSTTTRFDDLKATSGYGARAFGFSPTPGANNTLASILFGIRFDSNKNATPTESGSNVGSSVTYQDGDLFRVQLRWELFNGHPRMVASYIRIRSGVEAAWYTSAVTPAPTTAAPYYADSSFYHTGAALNNVTLRRFTYNIFQASDVIPGYDMNEWGDWPAKKMLTDDTLDTYQKREDRARAVFMKYAFPKVVLKVNTLEAITLGYRTIVYNEKLGYNPEILVAATIEKDFMATKNPAKPVYVISLGDSDREYGDQEPLGFLVRGTINDTQAPNIPSGLAAPEDPTHQGEDTPTTVYQIFTLVENGEDTKEYDFELSRPHFQSVFRTFPANQQAGYMMGGLGPKAQHYIRVRARDYNQNTSEWSDSVAFRSGDITIAPPSPFAVSRYGYGKGNGAWVVVGWTLPNEPQRAYFELQKKLSAADSWQPSRYAPRDSVEANVDDIVAGLAYDYRIRTVVGGRVQSDYPEGGTRVSAWAEILAYTVPALPSKEVYNSGAWGVGPGPEWVNSTIPGWYIDQQDSGCTIAIDTGVQYRGMNVLKIVTTNGGVVKLHSGQFPVVAAYNDWAWAAAKNLVNVTNDIKVKVQYRDSVDLGTGTVDIINGLVGTSFAVQDTMVRSTVPINSIKGEFFIQVTGQAPSGGTAYIVLPDYGTQLRNEQVRPIYPWRIYGTDADLQITEPGDDTVTFQVIDDGTPYHRLVFKAGGGAGSSQGITIGKPSEPTLKIEAVSSSVAPLNWTPWTSDPSGATDGDLWTVKDNSTFLKLMGKDATVGNVVLGHSLAARAETSFPGSPIDKQKTYRYDQRRDWFRDNGNSKWYGQPIYIPFHNYLGAPPYTVTTEALAMAPEDDFALWLERFNVGFYVGGTNDASNYWVIYLRQLTSGVSVNNLASITTQSEAANTWKKKSTAVNVAANATDIWLQVYVETHGSPAGIYVQVGVRAREIG